MSQSATLYRISQDYFNQLEQSGNRKKFNIITIAKNYMIFHGSFMGLEYVLSKGKDAKIAELLRELFSPKQALGGQEFDRLSPLEQLSFYESGNYIPYLDTVTISRLNDFLDTISEADIHSNYSATELNEYGIYPEVWHNDNSPNQAYNKKHLLDDFTGLKTIIKQASQDKDNILVFVG
jgi:hypothetical protein